MTSPLSTPCVLPCGTALPNRLCKAAMTEGLADEWGRATESLCRLYEKWSAGGAGLLMTGNVQVDRRYIERPGNVCIDGTQDDEQMERLKAFAKAGQSHNGSKIFVQLSHAGRQSNGAVNMSPVGPGNVRLDLPKAIFGTPRALEVNEIDDIKNRFVYAATVCKQCGFDGVQIHSAHGYLLSSFLNPRANNRGDLFGEDDIYSGSLENRSRLLLSIVREVRTAVGPAFPIAVKLNSADFQEGGFTSDEAVKVACLLEGEGIDLLEISGGNYEVSIFEDTTTGDSAPPATDNKRESTKKREAYFLVYAAEVVKVLKRVPVLVSGGWRTRLVMESAIQEKECAMIGIARPFCGYPDGANKLLAGSIDNLPSYEATLQTGHWSLQWVYSLPFAILKLVQLAGHMAWYYMNIREMAETGGDPSLTRGCFTSYISNVKCEQHMAANMKGDVQCEGSTYKGPAKK